MRHPKQIILRSVAVGGAMLLVGAGCAGNSPSPTSPAPTGGQNFVLDYTTFTADISPLLEARGCNAEGDCHGGGIRGSFVLSPSSTPDPQLDFTQAAMQVRGEDPSSSPLLLKPLDESVGGAPHAFTAFSSTADSDYLRILSWIRAGEFK
jgi:hypothetical protein